MSRGRGSCSRRSGPALLACLTLAACGDSGLSWARADERASDHPGRLVTLADGRRLNMRCTGRGAPTVILESGWGASSSAWIKVQPALARTTRVCSYDRAGNGLSDPGPDPRDGAAIARDLDQALHAAGINGPFILVGHSAGGLYVRLLAARRPKEVRGLVLLDPTLERRLTRDGLDRQRQRLQRCLAAAEAAPHAPLDDPRWDGCISPKPAEASIAALRNPGAWSNQLSELNAIFGRTSDQVMRVAGLLRAIPAYVITASDTAATAPKFGSQSAWELQQQGLAQRFEHGSQRTVLSGHLLMIERPDVVIEATQAMIAAARAGRRPDPLPLSEGPREGEEDPFKTPAVQGLAPAN